MATEARDATKVTHRSGTSRDPVRLWVDAFNRADADALAAFYADDAVNHRVAEPPMKGKSAIREMLASAEMVCLVENLFENGEWAILEWKDPPGLARLRLLPCSQRQDRLPARLLGQTLLPPAARLAASPGVICA